MGEREAVDTATSSWSVKEILHVARSRCTPSVIANFSASGLGKNTARVFFSNPEAKKASDVQTSIFELFVSYSSFFVFFLRLGLALGKTVKRKRSKDLSDRCFETSHDLFRHIVIFVWIGTY